MSYQGKKPEPEGTGPIRAMYQLMLSMVIFTGLVLFGYFLAMIPIGILMLLRSLTQALSWDVPFNEGL